MTLATVSGMQEGDRAWCASLLKSLKSAASNLDLVESSFDKYCQKLEEVNGLEVLELGSYEKLLEAIGVTPEHRHYQRLRAKTFFSSIPVANPDKVNQYTAPRNVTKGDGSQARIVARLKRDRPDLAKKVTDGEVTPRQAALAAGFGRDRAKRDPYLSQDTRKAAQRLIDAFGADWCRSLYHALKEALDG